MAILDPALGFVPKACPKFYQTVQVASNVSAAIGKGTPVTISGGYAVAATAGTGSVVGIALAHVPAGGTGEVIDLPIIADEDVIFEVTAEEVFAQTDVGKFVEIATNGVNTSTYNSTATIDLSAANLTPTADTPFMVVGASRVVTDAADSVNFKIYVKLVEPFFDKNVDAIA